MKKVVYPYQYMDEWENFNETLLPKKERFYSNLNMEDVKDSDWNHAKRVCKDFEIKNLGEYHDLYLESDVLLMTNVFEYFTKMCWEIHELDPAKFLSSPGLTWQAELKKNKVEIELLADTDMFLMVEKVIR